MMVITYDIGTTELKTCLYEINRGRPIAKIGGESMGYDLYVLENGGVEQDEFLNAVLEGETTLNPLQLLAALNKIEADAGRIRDVHWGPRTLDLDIIFYDDLILDSERLIIPHKEMHKRDFVLEPLCQLAPWKRHPLLGMTVEEMLEELDEEDE